MLRTFSVVIAIEFLQDHPMHVAQAGVWRLWLQLSPHRTCWQPTDVRCWRQPGFWSCSLSCSSPATFSVARRCNHTLPVQLWWRPNFMPLPATDPMRHSGTALITLASCFQSCFTQTHFQPYKSALHVSVAKLWRWPNLFSHTRGCKKQQPATQHEGTLIY